jgi:hypothetical protein
VPVGGHTAGKSQFGSEIGYALLFDCLVVHVVCLDELHGCEICLFASLLVAFPEAESVD